MSFNTMEFPRVAHIVADLGPLEEEHEEPIHVPRNSRAREIYTNAPSLKHTIFARWLPAAMLALLAGCASTGSTFRSGVGDAFLENAPYYAGRPAAAVANDARTVAHLPIVFQRGASQAPIFDPESDTDSEIAALLADMNAYLASLRVSVQKEGGATFTHAAIAPDVQFGCATTSSLPGDDCAERGDSALGRGRQTMRLAVGRPSEAWVAETRTLLAKSGATHALVITLEIGQYLTRQSGWRGSKSVELGSNHVESLPWLTSLETPVTVLQLTGALVDTTGSALRIGAEGIAAQRTRLLVSAVGGQELFDDQAVKRARTARRDDLAGAPLTWQVALRQLVVQLTGAQP